MTTITFRSIARETQLTLAETADHLSRLMDRARRNGDVELYCSLQSQLADVLTAVRASR